METITTPILSVEERLKMPFKMFGSENSKQKIVDVDLALQKILETRSIGGIIEIRPIRIDRYKETRVTITYTKDVLTGIYYGIPIGVHQDGNIKWRKITLSDRNVFDLKKVDEARMWFCARLSPFVIGSPFSGFGTDPVFEIYDPENEASKIIGQANNLTRALNRAKTMKRTAVLNFGRYLGVNIPPEYSDNLIRAEIIKFANVNPVEFNRKFEDTNRKIAEVLYSGVSVGIVNYEPETGFIYRGTGLGTNEPDALKTLQKDTITLSSIIASIKEIDRTFGVDIDAMDEGEASD